MRVPCNQSPIKGLFNDVQELERVIADLQDQGGVDLSGYATTQYVDDNFVTDGDLADGLSDKADVVHSHNVNGVVYDVIRVTTTTVSQIEVTSGRQTIPNFAAAVSIADGDTIEVIGIVPGWGKSGSAHNFRLFVTCDGQEQACGQNYLGYESSTVWATPIYAYFTNLTIGFVYVEVDCQILSGGSITFSDNVNRYPTMTIKRYHGLDY